MVENTTSTDEYAVYGRQKKTCVFCLGLNALQQQQRLVARTDGFSCLCDMANLVHILGYLQVDQMAVTAA